MVSQTKQLKNWSGEFGNDYVLRNSATERAVGIRTRAWAEMLAPIQADFPRSFLEVGCNVGINQRAIGRLLTAEHYAVEPNSVARDTAIRDGVMSAENLKAGHAGKLPFPDACADIAFTCGVLIHIHPEHLDQACHEIYRVSRRYVLCSEYFSHSPETRAYHGQEDLLFKRDFGLHWLTLHPDLQHVANGFFWQPTTGIDNVHWWLFRKQ